MATQDSAQVSAAKERLAKANAEKAKIVEESTKRMESTPTPTQEENDLAALGVHIEKHADDGSGPEFELVRQVKRKNEEAEKPAGSYQTRQSTAATPARSGSSGPSS